MDRLSGDFNRGYTKAIRDIQKIFDYIQDDLLFHHKRMNGKIAKELLDCVLDNRDKLRDNRSGFIRYNHVSESFEFFSRQGNT